MKTISNSQLCEGLKISRRRVDQWLSRGFLTLEIETSAGRERQWTLRDAIKLAALRDIADAEVSLEQVAPHLGDLTGFNRFEDEPAYLVIFYGPIPLIPFSNPGDPPFHLEDAPIGSGITRPGYLEARIFSGANLLNFLAKGGARVAIVIPRDLIAARVDRIFAEAGE